jgi:regulator of sigma E protease
VEYLSLEFLASSLLAASDLAAMGGKVFNALSVVLGLGLVIFFHELGHFMVAKWCNVHVERFSIGIGPIIWSRQKGETEYALSALPFGGYVKMLGQDDMDANQMTSTEIAENPRAYSSKTVPQRMAIISAGVIMNVVTGFLFFMICYRIGVEEPSPIIGSVVPGFPAWNAGLRAGDRVTAVNGEEIRSFGDIFNAVVLSSGEVRIQGVHEDGVTFDETMSPEKGVVGRSVGISPAMTPRLSPSILDDRMIPRPGLPASAAKGQFHAGDQLISLQGEPVKSFSQLQLLTARNAENELTYVFERPESKDSEGRKTPKQEITIRVPPAEVKSIGLWMAIGPVKAVRKGSIAEAAGLMVGDRIVAVDGQTVGRDCDPLQLPNYCAARAGQEVTITIERQTPATGVQTQEIRLIPSDLPGWTETPAYQTSPLPIPAIGAAFQVQPRIAKIIPGSEAEKSGIFREGQKITKISLEHTASKDADAEIPAAEKVIRILKLSDLDEKQPGTVEDINWAYAFAAIQHEPDRQVRLYIEDGDNTPSHLLVAHETVPGWHTWIRGINGWENAVERQQAGSLADAFALGLRKTKNTGINIYMTLRSLIRRDLPVDSLSGPLGIVNIGYKVAERGTTDLLLFLGFLSINLAVINFLPIPVLDGGHMVFLLWEGISRRKPNARVIGWAHGIGIIFIISLFIFVMYLDIFVNKMGMGG